MKNESSQKKTRPVFTRFFLCPNCLIQVPELESATFERDETCRRSTVSSCTTIAPEDVRERMRKQLQQKKHREMYKKSMIAKGESSATNRSRRDNRDIVKQYAGWEEF